MASVSLYVPELLFRGQRGLSYPVVPGSSFDLDHARDGRVILFRLFRVVFVGPGGNYHAKGTVNLFLRFVFFVSEECDDFFILLT